MWRARVRNFNAFKSQTQVNSKTENPLPFLKMLLFSINYIYAELNHFITFFYILFVHKRSSSGRY